MDDFLICTPTPQDFPLQGVFDDPPPPGISRILIGDFLPPSEIQSVFCTYKRTKWILSWLHNVVEFYYITENIKVNFNKNITLC